MITARLSNCFFYPVKSLRGIVTESLAMTPRGPLGDRIWMVVDENSIFLSQRSTPRLAAISATPDDKGGLKLELDGDILSVPDPVGKDNNVLATVWQDQCMAWDAGDEAAAWLSAILQKQARLVRLDDTHKRPVNPEFGRPGDEVGFADAYPVLITNTASLKALEPHFSTKVSMDRFRPNLVIDGAAAFAEDNWQQIKIGDVIFDIVKPCDRCATTIVDQKTGIAQPKEPLKTLAKFRRGTNGGVYFGQNAIPRNMGTVKTGDPVTILASGTPHPLIADIALTTGSPEL